MPWGQPDARKTKPHRAATERSSGSIPGKLSLHAIPAWAPSTSLLHCETMLDGSRSL